MGSGNRISETRIPATLRLAGRLLSLKAQDQDSVYTLCATYTEELRSGQSNVAAEFAPFLFYLINNKNLAQSVPIELMDSLRERAKAAARIAIARRHIIKKIGNQLASANIKAILLKGAAMDRWVYPDQAFRLGSDIDLLVREEDYPHIYKILAPVATAVEKYPGREAFTQFSIEKPFLVSKPAQVYLDVHRDLTIPFVYSIDPSQLFERAVPHPAHDNLQVLSPEDNLLHFAIHSFYDMRLFSKQTLDTCLLILGVKINWVVLEKRAREFRAKLPLAYLLKSVEEVHQDVKIPEHLKELSNPRKWAMVRLLTAHPAVIAERNFNYRIRQLACQAFLSGNIRGYTKYNAAYTRAKIRR